MIGLGKQLFPFIQAEINKEHERVLEELARARRGVAQLLAENNTLRAANTTLTGQLSIKEIQYNDLSIKAQRYKGSYDELALIMQQRSYSQTSNL
jgi:regulator of replication initiation timing